MKNEKLKKEQQLIRKIGIILMVIGFLFFPVACILNYNLLGISGILVTIGALLTVRSYVHSKYKLQPTEHNQQSIRESTNTSPCIDGHHEFIANYAHKVQCVSTMPQISYYECRKCHEKYFGFEPEKHGTIVGEITQTKIMSTCYDENRLTEDITLDFTSIHHLQGHASATTMFIADKRIVVYETWSSGGSSNREELAIPSDILSKDDLIKYVKEKEPFWIR